MVATARAGSLAAVNPRTTAILALVVAALGAFVYFYEIRGAEGREAAEAESKRLFPGLEAAQITSVRLRTSDDQDARAERVDEGWRLREPLDFPADGPALEGLASALAQLSSEAVFDEPAPLADYGLGEEVRVSFRAGETEYALRVGDKSPVGGNTYVATEADAPVYAVASYRTNALAKRLEELQDKQIVRFDPESVRAIDASWPGGSVKLEKREGTWHLTAPLETEADGQTVDDLLSDLAFLRANGFLGGEAPSDVALQLDSPEFQAELELEPAEEGGEARTVSVAIGASLDGENRAVRGTEPTVRYSIPAGRLDELPRKPGAYRFRELARFDGAEARRLELAFQDEEAGQSAVVTGTRGPAGWSTEPEAMSPVKVGALVARLARLRAEDVFADGLGEMERAFMGLAPPRVQLRVYGEEPDEGGEAPLLADVSLGKVLANQGIVARRPDRDTVYVLDYDLAEYIPVSLEALRNRFLAEEPVEEGGAEPGEAGAPPGNGEVEAEAEAAPVGDG